jgi:hypothetical protein
MKIKLLNPDQLRLGDLTATTDNDIGIILSIDFLVKSQEYKIVRLWKSGNLNICYYGKLIRHCVYRS